METLAKLGLAGAVLQLIHGVGAERGAASLWLAVTSVRNSQPVTVTAS